MPLLAFFFALCGCFSAFLAWQPLSWPRWPRVNIPRVAVQSSGAAALPNKRSRSGLGTSWLAIESEPVAPHWPRIQTMARLFLKSTRATSHWAICWGSASIPSRLAASQRIFRNGPESGATR